ncbi:MAG TPA: alpha/beta fold hydrolase [Opitutaceae bacterium]|nr:alpha/beta fold hydrolase [Opitutaceae bacterium]
MHVTAGWLIAVVLTLGLTALPGQPIPIGPAQQEFQHSGVGLTLFTYKPPTYKDGPLLLVFHGVNRNAEDYRNFAITLGERAKAVVIAPLFDRERFPSERYQRGGLFKAGKLQPPADWTYALVQDLVKEIRRREGRPDQPYILLGHSAGGQFLVRLAAFAPGDATRIVAANPGSHLFPTREAPFGYGFGQLPAELQSDDVIKRYLAAPIVLYLGTADIDPADRNLDRSPEPMRQGATRYERGQAVFAAAQALAAKNGWSFAWRKVETPGIAHNAAEMFAAGEAMEAVFGVSGQRP